MRIIPAIDIIDGKCVRLSRGNYSTKKIYNENPVEVAKKFESSGIEYLHLIDLDGAKNKHVVNYQVLREIANNTSLKIEFGGGLRSEEDLKIVFENGADQVISGSVAHKNSKMFSYWVQYYGPKKVILGADIKNEKIAINGWQESTNTNLTSFIQNYLEVGIKYVICTDIGKDGMLNGPAFNLYRKIIKENKSFHLIASGGITSLSDVKKLSDLGCEASIIGKAIYENKITLKELENYILKNNE